MSRSPVIHAHDRRGQSLLARSPERQPDEDVVVIEPEFAAGTGAAFPPVRLVRRRCAGDARCDEARCPAGSRQIAAGEDPGAARWVMCA